MVEDGGHELRAEYLGPRVGVCLISVFRVWVLLYVGTMRVWGGCLSWSGALRGVGVGVEVFGVGKLWGKLWRMDGFLVGGDSK